MKKKRGASRSTVSKAARDHERAAAAAMSEVVGREVKRRVVGEEAQPGQGLGYDLNGCEPFVVQCKHGVRIDYSGALEEAASACKRSTDVALAITRRVGGQAMVTMYLDDFVVLAKRSMKALREPKAKRGALPQGVMPEVVPKVFAEVEFPVSTKVGEPVDMPELFEE